MWGVGAKREGEKYQSGECLYISLALKRHYFGGLQYQPSRSQALTLAKHPRWERYTTETEKQQWEERTNVGFTKSMQ